MDFEKVATKLQFDIILEALKSFSYADANSDKILSLKPFDTFYEANEEIDELSSFYDASREVNFPRILLKDMGGIFLILKKDGSFLQPLDFLSILDLLKLSSELKKIIEDLGDTYFKLKLLYQGKLHSFKYIENLIQTSFDESGDFLDSASPDLKRIRQKIRDTRNDVIEKLNNFLYSGFFINIIQENIITIRNNRYVVPLKSNFHQKIKGIIQDYSSTKNTIFVEPEFIVNLNNKLAYLQQEEYNEKIRILTELTDIVKSSLHDIEQSYKTLLTIDFKLAKVNLAKKYNFSSINLDEGELKIISAKNPILVIKEKDVTPIDILFENNKKILIVTGANTGGKSVALKTLGLITLMAKSGLPVPAAKESKIMFFENVFVDIGDSQDISSDLSTFSAHIKNINSFLDRCNHNSLVLIDELGTGTDPKDGAAIGRAMIEYFIKKGVFALLTTHIEDLKFLNYIYNSVENVSVSFDEHSIKPEYRLIYGVSGRSYAINIAEKLNFNREIIEASKKFYNENSSEFIQKLIDIDNLKRDLLERERQVIIEKQKVKIEQDRYLRLREKMISSRDEIKDAVREKYKKRYEKFISEIDTLFQESKSVLAAKDFAKLMEKKRAKIDELSKNFIKKIKQAKESSNTNKPDIKITDFDIGSQVKHIRTNQKGRIESIDLEKGKFNVLFDNNLKLTLHFKEFVPLTPSEKRREKIDISYSYDTPNQNNLSGINFIGKSVEEAVFELEKLIDQALLTGVDKLEIIHGLGSGRLKRGIDQYLKGVDAVKRHYSPIERSGGLGITIIELN